MLSKLKPISQYIKDLSFENYAAQNGIFSQKKPELHLDLNIRKKVLNHDHTEITLITLIKASTDNKKIFVLELTYSSTFLIPTQTISEDDRKITFIECPKIMFPFIRQIVFNITRDSGFPPINLDFIDFNELFHSTKQH